MNADSSPNNTKFIVNYVISLSQSIPIINKPLMITTDEEAIHWYINPEEISNATFYTSTGRLHLPPVISNNTISNPSIIEQPEQGSVYSIYLSFDSTSDIMILNETMTCAFAIASVPTSSLYKTFTTNLPADYTVLGHNANQSIPRNNQQTLTWNLQTEKQVNILVNFLPFQYIKTLQSLTATLDVENVFPIRGAHKFTSTEVYTSTAQFGNWEVKPIEKLSIPFPFYGTNIQVEEVSDGNSTCERSYVTNNNDCVQGYFFVDEQNNVIVCPRYSRFGDNYQYSITVKFNYSTNASQETDSSLPYTFRYYFFLLKDFSSSFTITAKNFTLNCLFPQNTDPQPYAKKTRYVKLDTVNGRPQGTFTDIPLETGIGTIMFDIIPLRDFYNWQWASLLILALLLILAIVTLFLKPKTKKVFMVSEVSEFSLAVIVFVKNLLQFWSYSISAGFNLSTHYHLFLGAQFLLLVAVPLIPLIIDRYLTKKQQKERANTI